MSAAPLQLSLRFGNDDGRVPGAKPKTFTCVCLHSTTLSGIKAPMRTAGSSISYMGIHKQARIQTHTRSACHPGSCPPPPHTIAEMMDTTQNSFAHFEAKLLQSQTTSTNPVVSLYTYSQIVTLFWSALIKTSQPAIKTCLCTTMHTYKTTTAASGIHCCAEPAAVAAAAPTTA